MSRGLIIKTHPRVIREGSTKVCAKCNSSLTRVWLLGLIGKLKCDNKYCDMVFKQGETTEG